MPFETLPSDRRCGSHAEKNGSNSTTGWQHHSVSCKGQAWCLSIVSRADIHDKLHWLIQNSCNYPGAYVGRLHIIVFFASFTFASSLVPSQLSKSLVLPSALIEETVHPTPLKLQPPNIRLAFQSCEHQEQHCWAVWNLTNLQIESHPKAHLRDGSLSRWKKKHSFQTHRFKSNPTNKKTKHKLRAIFYFRWPWFGSIPTRNLLRAVRDVETVSGVFLCHRVGGHWSERGPGETLAQQPSGITGCCLWGQASWGFY